MKADQKKIIDKQISDEKKVKIAFMDSVLLQHFQA